MMYVTGMEQRKVVFAICMVIFCLTPMGAGCKISKINQVVYAEANGSGKERSYAVPDNNKDLMYPVSDGDHAVKIGSTRQLFVDDYLIAAAKNVKRTVHKAEKHPANPIMVADQPCEKSNTTREGLLYHYVLRDEATGKFRMWYSAYQAYELPSGERVVLPSCYAESDDGINWVKPKLGLYEFDGSTANNIIIPEGYLCGVIYKPNEPDPDKRYQTLVWITSNYAKVRGFYLYTSPDGIHWIRQSPLGNPPLIGAGSYSGTGVGDTSSFRWDPWLNKYIGDVKYFPGWKFRCFAQVESDDMVNWTKRVTAVYPDAYDTPDVQIYQHRVFNYESMWIGLLRVYHKDLTPSRKQTPLELTASRDGRNWERVGTRGGLGEGRQEFMSVDDSGDWDDNYLDSEPPILVGDELWFYYRGVKLAPRGVNLMEAHQIGLAKLRRDGFVSIDGGLTAGKLLTRPLIYNGSKLYVNAEVGPGGYVKAGICGTNRRPVKNYGLEKCVPVTENTLSGQITWRKNGILPKAKDPKRILFELKNAKLYSFWIIN